MDKFLELIKGKKTYAIAIIMAGLGVCQGLDWFTMPEFSWAILGALGLGTLRAGVNSISDTVKPPSP